MSTQHELVWFNVRKNRKRTTFDIAWGNSPDLNGWDLMMWQRTCQEFRIRDRVCSLFDYNVKRLPGDFEMVACSPYYESVECLHCPEDLVDVVRTMVLEAKRNFLRNYYVGAHNE